LQQGCARLTNLQPLKEIDCSAKYTRSYICSAQSELRAFRRAAKVHAAVAHEEGTIKHQLEVKVAELETRVYERQELLKKLEVRAMMPTRILKQQRQSSRTKQNRPPLMLSDELSPVSVAPRAEP